MPVDKHLGPGWIGIQKIFGIPGIVELR